MASCSSTKEGNQQGVTTAGISANKRTFAIKTPKTKIWLCLGILIALVMCCYLRTLGNYFLADDFGEVLYASHIWSGSWQDYWLDWISNVQRLPGMAVYRPWFVTTLVADYAIWHANPFGYYLTNVFHITASVLLLFFIVRKLTQPAGDRTSAICGFFSAALFAVNPLHCESISWSGGRTDTISCTYFLASLLLFLHAQSKNSSKTTILSVGFFWLGLLTKEMSIALPAVITAIAFLLPSQCSTNKSDSSCTFRSTVAHTLKTTAPYWVSTVIYFIVRYMALGTLVGGYTTSFGVDQTATAIKHILEPHNYYYLLFPLAAGIFPPNSALHLTLLCCYVSATALMFVRIFRQQISLPHLQVLLCWLLATALPIYQVWGLGLNLEGARYFYFLTVPLSLCIPIALLMPPSTKRTHNSEKMVPLDYLSLSIMIVLVLANLKITGRENGAWVYAGREVRAALSTASQLESQVPGNNRILLLGIPKTHIGAHLIYNGATFFMALGKPFFKERHGARFETFDPQFFGPNQFINSTRFKHLLKSGSTQPFVWNNARRKWLLTPMEPQSSGNDPLALSDSPSGIRQVGAESQHFPVANISPLNYDFLEFQCRLPADLPRKVNQFTVRWVGSKEGDGLSNSRAAIADMPETPRSSGSWQTVRVPVSHYWHWWACGNIRDLSLSASNATPLDIRQVCLRSDNQLRPKISIGKETADSTGVFNLKTGATMRIDSHNIPGAAKILVECTKANVSFDMVPQQQLKSSLYAQHIATGRNAFIALDKSTCPSGSFCELRARALDNNDKALGEYSEPVTLRLSP